MGLSDVRDALAGQIVANVPGLNALPRMVQVNPPCAVVELDHIEYHDASMAEPLYHFKITVLVSMNDVEAADRQLEAYLAPESGIRYALEVDPTLGGVVSDTTVRTADGVQPYEMGAETFFGARFAVEVRP